MSFVINFLVVCCRDKVKSLSRITASRKKSLSSSAQPVSLKIIKHSEDEKVLWLRKLLHKALYFHGSGCWGSEATTVYGLGNIFQALITLFYGAVNVLVLSLCNVHESLEAALLTSFLLVLSYLSNSEVIQPHFLLLPLAPLSVYGEMGFGKEKLSQKPFLTVLEDIGVKMQELQLLHCAYHWFLLKSLNWKEPVSNRNLTKEWMIIPGRELSSTWHDAWYPSTRTDSDNKPPGVMHWRQYSYSPL